MQQKDLQLLQLIHYEGAGNKTPVLAIDAIIKNIASSPEEVRLRLEKDMTFRKWLKKQGQKYNVDSIMICYKSQNLQYDYVTFVGEPHSDLFSSFSNMCGNGIRCLALYIVVSENDLQQQKKYLQKGIKIWAGDVKHVKVLNLNRELISAEVEVNLGRFFSDKDSSFPFINTSYFNLKSLDAFLLPSELNVPDPFYKRKFGFGYNGDKFKGEPHLVLLNTLEEYEKLSADLSVDLNLFSKESILDSLSQVVCILGKEITFSRKFFPLGVNVNVGVITDNILYMATHERNLSESRDRCKVQQEKNNNICRCQTKACGTGGAVACNIAIRQGYMECSSMTTIHPGGILRFKVENKQTIMIGPARKVEFYD